MELSLTEMGKTSVERSTGMGIRSSPSELKFEVFIRESHGGKSWVCESGFQGSLGLRYKFGIHQPRGI